MGNRVLPTSDFIMGANERQVGGSHYKDNGKPEHWDLVTMYEWDYFQGQITKYLMRWRKKNGIQDLEKARHFLDKYIEVERRKAGPTDTASLAPVPPDKDPCSPGALG